MIVAVADASVVAFAVDVTAAAVVFDAVAAANSKFSKKKDIINNSYSSSDYEFIANLMSQCSSTAERCL